MIRGVSFQPGVDDDTTTPRSTRSPQAAQQAIKVLSLRLPRVVGAQALAPAPLLTGRGSGGNPRVDSVVSQVLARYFGQEPTGGEDVPVPMVPTLGPDPSRESGTMPTIPPVRFEGLRQQDDILRGTPPPIRTEPRITPGEGPIAPPGPPPGPIDPVPGPPTNPVVPTEPGGIPVDIDALLAALRGQFFR